MNAQLPKIFFYFYPEYNAPKYEQRKRAVKIFEQKQVRTHRDEEQEKWYFSVIDVIEILTESSIPKRYWSDLKKKLTTEGSEAYEKIVQLKFQAAQTL